MSESKEFSTKIPGIDIPFREYDPKYPPNPIVVKAGQNAIYKDEGYDCSEIAEDLLQAAGGEGRIIEVTPSEGKLLKLFEGGEVSEDIFYYHQVYTDDRYIYDPRLDEKPILKEDWEKLVRELNPGTNIKELE